MKPATLASLITLVTSAQAEPITLDRIEVVDGDTVLINGVRARLRRCDTPNAGCDPERQRGGLAADRLRALLGSGAIEINGDRRDPYRRYMVRLTVDGRDVCKVLIEEGLAVRYYGRGPRMD